LSTPVQTADGKFVDSVAIAKGTTVVIPVMMINRCEAFWGPDSREFKPERWLTKDGLEKAKDIQGHRNILTFSDGSRFCLGRGFALTEIKVAFFFPHTHLHMCSCLIHIFQAILCTVIRNFYLELPEGATIDIAPGISPRPKISGEKGHRLPLRVHRVLNDL
jgi:Cytochrome P450